MHARGFTLLEVMIASTVFVVVIGIALLFSSSASTQTDIETQQAFSQIGVLDFIDLVETELAQSSADYVGEYHDHTGPPLGSDWSTELVKLTVSDDHHTMEIFNGGEQLGFRVNNHAIHPEEPGFYQHNPVWSEPFVYRLALARGEMTAGNPDGIDQNRNGIYDELWFQRHNVATGEDRFIATQLFCLDPAQLNFELESGLLTMTLTYYVSTEDIRNAIQTLHEDGITNMVPYLTNFEKTISVTTGLN